MHGRDALALLAARVLEGEARDARRGGVGDDLQALDDAGIQLARYRQALETRYGGQLRLRTHAVVSLGLERLVWK